MYVKQKNSKYFLSHVVFEKYFQLLKSSLPRTKIVGLQKLDLLLRQGYELLPTDGKKLDDYLVNLLYTTEIGIEIDDAIRRCAYRICARRYDIRIYNRCYKLLGMEVCPDNKMSIIPVLLHVLSTDNFKKALSKYEAISGLTYQQIELAQFACPTLTDCTLEKNFLNQFLDKDDLIALRFFPIIYNEQSASLKNCLKYLDNDLFGELARHNDPWVQKYALGTFTKMKHFRVNDLKINFDNFLSLDAQPQKWVMTDIFLDKSFIRKHWDFIEEILSERHLFTKCDNRIKEGIAQGLLYYGYNKHIANYVISWYAHETDPSINILLRSYMMLANGRNKEFNYILSQEKGLYIPNNKQEKRKIYLYNPQKNNCNISILKINNSTKRQLSLKKEKCMKTQLSQEKITILFLGANSTNQSYPLNLAEEVRSISQNIRSSEYRDFIDFKTCPATRPTDILQAINETQPTIVHFSCHGESSGELNLLDSFGKQKKVSKEGITQALSTFSKTIRLVVFNTCYSYKQAVSITDYIDTSIGMSDAITDEAARIFAAQLYSSICFGHSLQTAFNQAKSALLLNGIKEDHIPRLYTRSDINPDDIILVHPK